MAYVPFVYRTSGGDQLNVTTGGVLYLDSGGTLTLTGQTVSTTGGLVGDYISSTAGTVASLNAKAVVSTGTVVGLNYVLSNVVAASSGGAAIPVTGVSEIWSSGTNTGHAWTMAASTAVGMQKWISCVSAEAAAPAVVTFTGTLINNNATVTFTTGATNRQWVHLIAQNSTNWFVAGMSTLGTAIP